MYMTHPGVATIGGDAEVDHAIATLVLAFVTDPVARWMYADPHRYLLTYRDFSEPSEKTRLKKAQPSYQRRPRGCALAATGDSRR
jgi:hypothetical protein